MSAKIVRNFILAILILSSLFFLKPNYLSKEKVSPKEPLIRELPFQISVNPLPKKIQGLPPPKLSAGASVVVDINSAKILYEKNKDIKLYPASTTKIMTALVANETFQENQVFIVDKLIEGDQKNNFFRGEKILFKDLLKALLLSSSNTAAEILARAHPLGREGFITDMNKKAKELSLKNTNFVNPTGFHDDNHYTTAYDLAFLAKKFGENPELIKITSSKEEIVSNLERTYFHNLKNTNTLVGKDGVLGIKTGWTEISRGALTTLVNFKGNRVISVVLKSEDRFTDTQKLLTWTASTYRW